MRWCVVGCVCCALATVLIVLIGWLMEERAYPARCRATRQTILTLAGRILQAEQETGRLPGSRGDLARQINGGFLKDAWGGPVDYQLESTNRFRLTAMSPYPHLDMFEYDSAHPQLGVQIESF